MYVPLFYWLLPFVINKLVWSIPSTRNKVYLPAICWFVLNWVIAIFFKVLSIMSLISWPHASLQLFCYVLFRFYFLYSFLAIKVKKATTFNIWTYQQNTNFFICSRHATSYAWWSLNMFQSIMVLDSRRSWRRPQSTASF